MVNGNESKALIIYLSGDKRRFNKVYQLYEYFNNSYDVYIMITPFSDQSELRGKTTLLLNQYANVPDENIITEYYSTSTLTSALQIKKMIDLASFKNIYIVTSPYHILRSKKIFSDVFGKDLSNEFYFVHSDEKFNHIVKYASEIVKYIFYQLKLYKLYQKRYYRLLEVEYQEQSRGYSDDSKVEN
ncbi:YdcF family protein [Salinicoccus roseus]|uniref:YdcF family protein n=1 Tax=Salinicoccus roseus TaxID=45670 RepID=UPI001EF71651|nr:YdcF family protein [Salinicoccus roseus]MCG7333060.1 YdcF family protein [Salinicoccus roseus]